MESESAVPGKYVTILSGVLALCGLYVISRYNYLLFHGLVELFSVVVACGIFMIAWNTRRLTNGDHLLFLGIAYLHVAGVDVLHTLAYKGMGVFQGYDANLPTQLWIAARYVESLSLFIFPLVLRRRLNEYALFAGYALITGLLLVSIFHWGIFPDCYVEGAGLTPFKKISEYLISLVLLASVLLLLQKRRAFDQAVLRLLVLSIVVTIGSELAFTLYVSVYGFSNLVGHLFKVLSFYLIYKAIIETGLAKPYDLLFRNLRQSEEELRQRTVELQVRNEELDAFAQTVAHDLKNPLGVMIGFAQVLAKDYALLPDEDVRNGLRRIVQSGRKVDNIIDQLLLLAAVRKMEEVKTGALDMAAIVADAQSRLDHLIEAYQAEIILPADWPTAFGYGPWVETVWVNYLSNAIKYGGRTPRVELGGTVQADGMVRFWVQDNGQGLTPEEQARLFTPFERLGQVSVRGHGLGLSIVRRIVGRLGGQVGVESRAGQGSVFSFTLPGVAG